MEGPGARLLRALWPFRGIVTVPDAVTFFGIATASGLMDVPDIVTVPPSATAPQAATAPRVESASQCSNRFQRRDEPRVAIRTHVLKLP
jgi:hypothetical protein